MRAPVLLLLFGLGLAASGCGRPAEHAAGRIAWREGDVDDAFNEAREAHKPVLLYWGAKWCPPCNLMKQTLFKDPGFIAETRNFIPVHLDGDDKDAQTWGKRFGIQGYPTVIILTPDRTEVTRLDGGSTAGELTGVLEVAAKRTTSTEDLLSRAENPAGLSAADWRLLASFDWLDDPKHFGDQQKGAAFVARLADAAPDPAMKRRFALTALFMASGNADVAKLTPVQQAQVGVILPAILASDAEVRANRQTLSYGAAPLILGLTDPAERKTLSAQLVAALDKVAADPGVPLGDRLATANADIALSKAANGGKATPEVLAKVRERVAMADKAATDPQMRQAVMPDAAGLLADAGDRPGAEKLLEAELPRSVAPYYDMVDLAELLEKDKDDKTAIAWLKQAADSAQGPATRVQWAIFYSNGVMRMTPDDHAAVATAAGAVVDALGQNSSGYAERTEKKVAAWSKTLHAWSAAHAGADVLARLDARLAQACAKDGCQNALKT
jgi:protein disulfide-isomerase